MTRITWGDPGTKFFETGIDQGVLYVDSAGYAWNGLTAVTEKPSGGEAQPFYADGLKYLNLSSAEEFEATIEAFGAPPEFGPCDGTRAIYNGLFVGQQPRKAFGFTYRTLVGNDALGKNYGYKIHLIWNALAKPTERAYSTTNDSPEGVAMSWDITTLPPSLTGYKPTAYMEIDSRFTPRGLLKAIEDILYGSDAADARLPFQSELMSMFQSEGPITRRSYAQNPEFRKFDAQYEMMRNRTLNPSLKNDASDWSGFGGNQPPYSLANTYTYNRQAPPVPLTVPTYGGGSFTPAFCIVEQGGPNATFNHTDVTVSKSGSPTTPGAQVSAGIWVLTNRPMSIFLRVRFADGAGNSAGDAVPTTITTTAGVWQRITGTATSPANAASYTVAIKGNDASAAMSATDYIAVACPVIISGSWVPDYFDGDLAPSGGFTYVWAGNGTKYANNSVILAWPEMRRNLLTNPGIKAYSASSEIRRNWAADPTATLSAAPAGGWGWQARWFGSGAGAGTVSSITNASDGPLGIKTYLRKTWTAVPGNNGATGFQHSQNNTTGETVVSPNVWYAWGCYLRASSGGKYTRSSVEWRDSTHTKIGNEVATPVSSAPLVAGQWTRVTGAFQAPANAAYGVFTTDVYTPPGGIPVETVWAVGDTLDGTALIVEQYSMGVGSYFDGTTPASGGLAYSWTGAAFASASVARGNAGYEMYGPVVNYVNDQGQLVLIGYRTSNSNDTYTAPAGDTGAMRLGMQAGKTYTFSAEGYATAADPNEHSSYGRTINVWYKDGGGTYRVAGVSPRVPVGSTPTRVSVTAYIPSDATEAFVRFYNGSANRARDVVWQKALLEEADAALPYFDGNTPSADGLSYMWLGSVDRSVSIAYGKTVTGYNPTQNIVAWLGADGTSMRVLQKKGVAGFVEVSATVSTPTAAGDVVTMSVDASVDADSDGKISIATTGTQQTASGSTVRLTPAPQRLWLTSDPMPDGATKARLLFFPAAVGVIYTLRNVMMEKTAQNLPYFSGRTLPSGKNFYHWEGTPDSSTSVVNTWN